MEAPTCPLAAVGSTVNKVSQPAERALTIWGDQRRSFNKPRGSNECSRCPSPRDGKRPYCKDCHTEYMRLWRGPTELTPALESRLKNTSEMTTQEHQDFMGALVRMDTYGRRRPKVGE